MDFELKNTDWSSLSAQKPDVLLVLVNAADAKAATNRPQAWPEQLRPALQAYAAKDWTADSGSTLVIYQPQSMKARQIVVLGTSSGSPQDGAKSVSAYAEQLKTKGEGVLQLGLVCMDGTGMTTPSPALLQALALAVHTGSYTYTATFGHGASGKGKPPARRLKKLTVFVPALDKKTKDAKAQFAALQHSLMQAKAIGQGIELARECGNLPANVATPTYLAEQAQGLAKQGARLVQEGKASVAVQCEVLGPKEVAKLGMGSFMAVAQGADEPLRFIVLRYAGAQAKASVSSKTLASPIVLVGKGITFDTGGISLKAGEGMDEMKFDMCGAASVLGAFAALQSLQLPINVVGLIPACENMPSGRATRPGDVLTSMSGQTIEVLNTDAEGRLILCDALTYAERFKPKAVVDIATLTGACLIALGHVRSGMWSSSDELAAALSAAGEAALDPCWRMPLDDDYALALKSNFADVANVGGRPAGSITAAKFLQRFAKAYPWAHLDIAGTAWKSAAAKGATGRPVGLLVHYLLAQAASTAKVR